VNQTNGLKAGAVEISREFGVLDEGASSNQVFEFLGLHKEVLLSMDLSWTRGAGCV
jgi:hypothetical protein